MERVWVVRIIWHENDCDQNIPLDAKSSLLVSSVCLPSRHETLAAAPAVSFNDSCPVWVRHDHKHPDAGSVCHE